MPLSDILQIPVLTETMAQKTIGVNMAIQAMEKVMTAKLEIATGAATSTGFDLVIPFDTTNELSPRQALRAIYFRLLAGATHDFDLIHPDNPHLFIIKNDTTRTATLRTVTGGTTVSLPPSTVFLVYCDGLNMVKMDFTLTELTQANDFNFAFYGNPAVDQVMGRVLIGRNTTFPGNLSGAHGRVDVNPLASHNLGLWDDSTQFGTITISSSGSFTFATAGGSPRIVTAGSVLELRNGGSMDPLLDVVELVIPATVKVSQ